MLHASGGGLDLTPYTCVKAKTELQVLFLSGTDIPKRNLDLKLDSDSVYVPSTFEGEAVSGVFPQIFVTHYGGCRISHGE